MSGNKCEYEGCKFCRMMLSVCVYIGYPNGYTMSREELHSEAKLTGVLQRADKQLLKYMFDESKLEHNLVT